MHTHTHTFIRGANIKRRKRSTRGGTISSLNIFSDHTHVAGALSKRGEIVAYCRYSRPFLLYFSFYLKRALAAPTVVESDAEKPKPKCWMSWTFLDNITQYFCPALNTLGQRCRMNINTYLDGESPNSPNHLTTWRKNMLHTLFVSL